MHSKFLLLADAANLSREGKLNVAGEFNTFFAVQVPLAWPKLTVVARLEANVGEGVDHAVQLRLTDADGAVLLQTPPFPIKFAVAGRGIPARADVLIDAAGIVFPSYGDYTLHFFVDGVQRDDLTIYVRERPPQIAAQQPPAGPSA